MISTFPHGWPGAGLLLLRLTCGAVLIIQAVAYFVDRNELGLLMVAASVMSAVGFLLVIGLMTRYVAFVAAFLGLGSVFSWLPSSDGGPLVTPMTGVLFAVIAAAIVFLGPGALSLDSRLFGRREIIIPSNSSQT